LIKTLNSLTKKDLDKEIVIRNQRHSVVEAIHRQLSHYPYHIGQIVFIGKMLCGENWNLLSISKGNSVTYNSDKFFKAKNKAAFYRRIFRMHLMT
jgi:hypothetical protein